jgi:hypothetical protein
MSMANDPNVAKAAAPKRGWHDQDHVPGIKSELLELNMGPQHPATHGVLRLLLQTDGEIVYKVTPVLGYLHRCAEKIAEGVTTSSGWSTPTASTTWPRCAATTPT